MSNSATKYNVVNNLKNWALSNNPQILFLKGMRFFKKKNTIAFLTEEGIEKKKIFQIYSIRNYTCTSLFSSYKPEEVHRKSVFGDED